MAAVRGGSFSLRGRDNGGGRQGETEGEQQGAAGKAHDLGLQKQAVQCETGEGVTVHKVVR